MKSVAVAPAFICAAIVAVTFAQPANCQTPDSSDWIAYTAVYKETVSNPGQPQRSIIETVSRATDGSVLTLDQENGQMVGGKLWNSCGNIYGLDFNSHHAIFQRNSPRTHLQIPKAAPIGSDVIAGVPCSVYPLGVNGGGSGSLCVDTNRDIVVKEEIHLTQSNGKTDFVKEMTSFDSSKPQAGEKNRFPAGFEVLNPAGRMPNGCS